MACRAGGQPAARKHRNCRCLHLIQSSATNEENRMSRIRHVLSRWSAVFPLLILLAYPAAAQTCYTSGDMDVTTKAALEQTAQQIFAQSARGDYAGLRANSVASLAANFSGVES